MDKPQDILTLVRTLYSILMSTAIKESFTGTQKELMPMRPVAMLIVHFGKQLTAENGSLIYLGAVETGQNVADTVQDAVGVVTNTYDNAGKALGKKRP